MGKGQKGNKNSWICAKAKKVLPSLDMAPPKARPIRLHLGGDSGRPLPEWFNAYTVWSIAANKEINNCHDKNFFSNIAKKKKN